MTRPPDHDAALTRFVEAQSSLYSNAIAELRRGRKQGHWMWFVFPQIAGLDRFFDGQADDATLARLDRPGSDAPHGRAAGPVTS